MSEHDRAGADDLVMMHDGWIGLPQTLGAEKSSHNHVFTPLAGSNLHVHARQLSKMQKDQGM